ncbi:hypothetical protein EON76_06115 [bacterium]|nr:MAG: hypothetical protein EON76_06115 [bacterium]
MTAAPRSRTMVAVTSTTHTTSPVKLLDNGRFYILAVTCCIALLVPASLRLSISSDQLLFIRIEQVYGLLAVAYWYIVLLIAPLRSLFTTRHPLRALVYHRRALGVSAAVFAALHGIVALFGQLGGVGGISQLPQLFQWSVLAGSISMGFLILMAVTSFDRIVTIMTPRYWKMLHRTGYIGGVAVLLHIWTIGTHISYSAVQIAALTALIILGGLESYRAVTTYAVKKQFRSDRATVYTLIMASTVIWSAMLLFIPVYIENYHAARHATSLEASHE